MGEDARGWERTQEDARGRKRRETEEGRGGREEEGSKKREEEGGKKREEEGRRGKKRRDRNWNNLTGSGHEKEARPLLV